MRVIKNLPFFLLFILSLSSCRSVYVTSSEQKEINERVALVVHAEKFTGISYRYGGNTPTGFDCSGFVNYVFGEFGYKLPRHTGELIKTGKKTNEKNAEPGDLIFFRGRNKGDKTPGHVGIITKTQGSRIYFIHASSSLGIREDSNDQEYYRSRFLQIRKIF
jgi:Cell wall-associated hydrolases (invasion-associated proteins)